MDPAYDRSVEAVRFLRQTGKLPEDGTHVTTVWTTVTLAVVDDSQATVEQPEDAAKWIQVQ